MHRSIACCLLIAVSFSSSALAEEGASAVADPPTSAKLADGALADYLTKEDPSYRWVKMREGELGSTEYVELILTSQTWRDIVWKHRLFIITPKSAADSKQAIMLIAGGGWDDKYEDPDRDEKLPGEAYLFAGIAERLKSPIAILLNVPQQPIFGGMVEDQIISLTFEKFIKTKDPEWPLLLPMVKSAVRAMDTVQEYCRDEWAIDLESFTVTGASKRGWTTWLTGASDSRVTAIAPMVIDMLNLKPQMEHQRDVWGGYSEQIADYTERGIQDTLEAPEGKMLRQIVDPYAYRNYLTQPKLIMLGTNDRYWPIDALNLYWKDLAGQKHILYVPNKGHGLDDFPRILGSLAALHEEARGGEPMPKLEWSFEDGGEKVTLHVESNESPSKIQVWSANSSERDFRDSKWSPTTVKKQGDSFSYEFDRPEAGHAAFFAEAVYKRDDYTFYLSTNVKVVPAEAASGGE